jgi:hypothetical protein
MTPSEFWAVIAVIAVIAWPPSIVTVFTSAWMPAPPPESEPAMINILGMAFGMTNPLAQIG